MQFDFRWYVCLPITSNTCITIFSVKNVKNRLTLYTYNAHQEPVKIFKGQKSIVNTSGIIWDKHFPRSGQLQLTSARLYKNALQGTLFYKKKTTE